ncbi:MAG TPA: tetratricopeptide repeat protein, partial [Vicingus sp.]|nr:tetratricopeptide repeat protein [Vicingus sp.]
NTGLIFMGQNKYDDAITYFNTAVNILKSKNYIYALPNVLNNLGIAYRNINNHKESLKVYEQALKIYEEINDTISQAMVLENMAMVFLDQKQYDKSIDFAKKALIYATQFADTASMIKTNNILADNYLKINKLNKSEEYSANSIRLLTRNSKDKSLITSTFQTIRQIKIYKQDYKAALFYTDSLIVLDKEIALNESENNIGYFKVELDLVSKEREIEILNSQNELKQKENDIKDAQLKVRRNQQFFLFGGLILVLVFAGFMYNRFKVTQKQNKLIEEQKQLVEKQKHIIEEKHKEVLDSIRYAKRIQDALITPMSYIERNIKRLKDY